MANVNDVAAYIVNQRGPMSAMKLQKLCYYSQAWHSVWESRVLFDSQIQAWANGPVIPELYARHRGRFLIESWDGNVNNLDGAERASVDAVLDAYADKSPQWLSELTHMEQPWKSARQGLAAGERGSNEITVASMNEYYEGLLAADNE